jgi:hypothetical protein
MATVLEEYNTEEQRYVVRLLLAKRLNANDNHKEIFPAYIRKCLSPKAVYIWVEKLSQERSKLADDETEVRHSLRQHSKDFYAAGFCALIERQVYQACQCWWEILEKCFSHIRISRVLRFISICDLFTDSSS